MIGPTGSISMTPEISIPGWYKDKDVLISGGTGFVGKVMISKLLSSCPDGGSIFLLIREKKGVRPEARLQSLIQEEPFRVVREKYPDRLNRLKVIAGDTTIEDLGLTTLDKDTLVKRVSVIFHMAANVRFDLPLKTAINVNTRGTMNIISFAKQLPNLISVIHASTTYCQTSHAILEERAYTPDIQPEKLVTTVDALDDEMLNMIEPILLRSYPNTYAFSKCLSEDLMARSGLPVGVVRPSIVIASYLEPAPGFVDNINGPTGLILAGGKGVLQSMLCDGSLHAKIIPCDLTANIMIAFARKVGIEQPSSPIFINATDSPKNPITWGEAIEVGRKYVLENPFSGSLWYPWGSITTSVFVHWFIAIFCHILPAYFLDACFVLLGKKPFMIRVHSRIFSGLKLLQYYTVRDWVFPTDRLDQLQAELSVEDRKTFFMDASCIDWDNYMRSYILGIRKYVLKEDPNTLPQSRRVLRVLYWVDRIIRVIFVGSLIWYIYSWISCSPHINDIVIRKSNALFDKMFGDETIIVR